MLLFQVTALASLLVVAFSAPVNTKIPNCLVYGNAQPYPKWFIRDALDNAINSGVRMDPFCGTVMEAIQRHDMSIGGFFDFIFDGFEHSANNFFPEQAETWDFLINQAFIQYIQKQVNLGLSEDVEEYIFKRLIIPKYPILDLKNYKFDSKSFTEEDCSLRGDLTSHLEEAQVSTFFAELNSIIIRFKYNYLESGKTYARIEYKVILLTVMKCLSPAAVPFAKFMLCVPLELLENLYMPQGDFLSNLEYDFKNFVSKNVYKTLKKEHPEELEAILKSDSIGIDDFDSLMQIYESDQEALMDSDPIDNYFIKAVEIGDFEQIKLMKKVLGEIKRVNVENAICSSAEKGEEHIFELLMNDNREIAHQGGYYAFFRALEKDRRNILDLYLKGKVLRPCPDMLVRALPILFKNGNMEHIQLILEKKYWAGMGSENLKNFLLLLVQHEHEDLIRIILAKESERGALILNVHLRPVYDQILKGGPKLIKIFLEYRRIVERIGFAKDVERKFHAAINSKNWELVEIILESGNLDTEFIEKCHFEALESGDEEHIDVFETYFSNSIK